MSADDSTGRPGASAGDPAAPDTRPAVADRPEPTEAPDHPDMPEKTDQPEPEPDQPEPEPDQPEPEPEPVRAGRPDPSEAPVLTRGRVLVFALALALLTGVAVAYTLRALAREEEELRGGDGTAPSVARVELTGPPRLLFRSTESGPGYGHLGTVAATAPGGPRTVAAAMCDRVYAAGGTGVCLTTEQGVWARRFAVITDAGLRETRRVELPGTPNRARVSASGRMVSWTVFVAGDSYAALSFSTRTSILDTRSGELVASLEEFTTLRAGRPYDAPDRNFWGVTFAADDNTFYATMSPLTSGRTYLVRGDMAARTLTVLRDNVECPSLSPDGTRLVFKKKVSQDGRRPWRLHVLDLASGAETPLAEERSVDDQAVWLDTATVAYALPSGRGAATDVWAVPADGTGAAALLVPGAFSPVPLPAGGPGEVSADGASGPAGGP